MRTEGSRVECGPSPEWQRVLSCPTVLTTTDRKSETLMTAGTGACRGSWQGACRPLFKRFQLLYCPSSNVRERPITQVPNDRINFVLLRHKRSRRRRTRTSPMEGRRKWVLPVQGAEGMKFNDFIMLTLCQSSYPQSITRIH